jgi:peptidoglycan/xylan/chitin deacetylase (PgdA/CDA1 family)
VCITIDVEFTIGGSFADPWNKKPVADPSVLCDIDGESHGLGFILDALDHHGIKATFFVEALNSYYFGDAPMARFAQQILSAGHDVQLHLHPCWRHFRYSDWQERLGSQPPNDSMAGRDEAELCNLMSDGIGIFERWGIPRPVALRTGGLRTDLSVYKAMARSKIPLASNIGVGVYRPRETVLQLSGGRHWIHGVLEIPTLSYHDLRLPGYDHLKTLTVTGSSWQELRALLRRAHERQAGPVVILSHPSEFVKGQDVQYTRYHANKLNQRRFSRLCQFLHDHRETFTSVTFAGARDTWLSADDTQNPDLSVPLWTTLKRLTENRFNDFFTWY